MHRKTSSTFNKGILELKTSDFDIFPLVTAGTTSFLAFFIISILLELSSSLNKGLTIALSVFLSFTLAYIVLMGFSVKIIITEDTCTIQRYWYIFSYKKIQGNQLTKHEYSYFHHEFDSDGTDKMGVDLEIDGKQIAKIGSPYSANEVMNILDEYFLSVSRS